MSNVNSIMIVCEVYCTNCPTVILAGFPPADFGAFVDYDTLHVCPNCGADILVAIRGQITENAQFCDN